MRTIKEAQRVQTDTGKMKVPEFLEMCCKGQNKNTAYLKIREKLAITWVQFKQTYNRINGIVEQKQED